MGLSGRLAALGLSRTHVLVVSVPGWQALRIRVEDAVGRLGAVLAAGPADADLLLVAGRPGPGLSAAADRIWDQLPGPRARATIEDPADIDARLIGGIDMLRDLARQRCEAASRPPWSAHPGESDGSGDPADPADPGEMDMDMPAGLMMAERAEDRDGLGPGQRQAAAGVLLG